MIQQTNSGHIYPDKTIIQKDTGTPTFTAALFTTDNTWKQRKCPLREEWIKMSQYINYNGRLFSNKKEQNNVICSNMDATKHYQSYQVK